MLPNNPNVEGPYRTMLILWFAFLMSIVMYFVIGLVIPRSDVTENRLLTVVFSAIAVVLVGLSFAVKKKFLTQAVDTQQVRLVNTAFILAAALCEAGALFGLLDLFVAHDRYFFVLIAIAFVALLLHFPRRSDLEAASFKNQSGLS